jgi:glycosyltransferase involved in cell wall biosynthesis
MSKENNEIQEHEQGNHVLHLTINNKRYDYHQEYITGAEIRMLGNIPDDDEIFLAIKKPWEDELILDNKQVNLARPEIEHFYSKDKHIKITLIVNGRPKLWNEKTITFEQVVVLAFGPYDPNPNRVFTVTYDKGPHENPEGTMVKGDRVCVKDKMIFNVTCTDKS